MSGQARAALMVELVELDIARIKNAVSEDLDVRLAGQVGQGAAQDSLVIEAIKQARRDKDEATMRLRALVAYARQSDLCVGERPSWRVVGAAAGLSIAGARVMYGDDDVARVVRAVSGL